MQLTGMESDYEYDYSDDGFPESDEDMASGDDYEFDNQAELQSAFKKVCRCEIILTRMVRPGGLAAAA